MGYVFTFCAQFIFVEVQGQFMDVFEFEDSLRKGSKTVFQE